MFGIDDAILGGALSFGGKLLSGIGASSAAKKQQKVALAAQYQADQNNQYLQMQKNTDDAAYGQSILAHGLQLEAEGRGYVERGAAGIVGHPFDMSAFTAAGDLAGFNRVTWLNSGLAPLWDQRAGYAALANVGQNLMSLGNSDFVDGTRMKSPGITQYGVAQTVPQSSPLSALGDAVSAGSSSYFSATQHAADLDVKQAALGLLLQNVQKAKASGNPLAGIGTPAFSHAGTVITGGGAAAALSLGNKAVADALGIKDRTGEVSRVYSGEGVDSSRPDAMAVERRYGFYPAVISGLGNYLADAWKTPLGADPAKDYGFGTRFRSGANDAWKGSWWQVSPGYDTGEQVWSSAPPLFGN